MQPGQDGHDAINENMGKPYARLKSGLSLQ